MNQASIEKKEKQLLDAFSELNAKWEKEREAAEKPSRVTRYDYVWKPLETKFKWTTYHIQRVLRENGIDYKTSKTTYEDNQN